MLWERLQPIAFSTLACFGCSLGYCKCRWKTCATLLFCWICSQFPVNTKDYESLTLLWSFPKVNKPLLYPILGYCGTLWYGYTLTPLKQIYWTIDIYQYKMPSFNSKEIVTFHPNWKIFFQQRVLSFYEKKHF